MFSMVDYLFNCWGVKKILLGKQLLLVHFDKL